MINKMKVLAIICARGGSMGVKNKNIRPLAGKPLICYSLELLKQSRYVDDYVVSTDSDQIAQTVTDYGFRIDFKRPSFLSANSVSRLDVVRHAANWYAKRKGSVDIIVDFGVATPLKTVNDLDTCIALLADNREANVITVTPAEKNPYFNMVEEHKGKVTLVKSAGTAADRQHAPRVYSMNDAFNLFWSHHFLNGMKQLNDHTIMYVMPRERSVDIDEEIDFLFAETLITRRQNSTHSARE